MTTPAPLSPRLRRVALLLMGLALLMVALAIYQWLELVHVRGGGQALCSVNARINCETVWNSAFASRVHRWLGVPVAALGLIWGLTALGLAGRLSLAPADLARQAAVRLVGLAGVGACILFLFASLQSGALCLTCLTTYVLVLAYAATAVFALPAPYGFAPGSLRPALLWAGGVAIVCYLALLAPGMATPQAPSAAKDLAKAEAVASNAQGGLGVGDAHTRLVAFLGRLAPGEAQAVSDALAEYRSTAMPTQAFGFHPRTVLGEPSAPMHVTEFTDILCGHCKHLEETMQELRRVVPPGLMSVEPRYFPLDGECNPQVQHVGNSGVRCAGAKAQLCLEGAPDFSELRHQMFAQQETLTVERVMQIASSGSVGRAQLEACMASEATRQKLDEDIRYAVTYNLGGTPLVLVNGKEASSAPAFLYVMGLAGGNADAPEFSVLPTPTRGRPLP